MRGLGSVDSFAARVVGISTWSWPTRHASEPTQQSMDSKADAALVVNALIWPEAAPAVSGVSGRPAGVLAAIGMIVLLFGAVIFHRRAGDTAHEYAAALVFLATSTGCLAVWLCTTRRI